MFSLNRFLFWLVCLLSFVFIFVGYFFLDIPISYAFYNLGLKDNFNVLIPFTEITTPITFCIFLFYIYIYFKRRGGPLSENRKDLLFIANAVVFCIFIKNLSKPVFGRYWPNTWVYNNPSLLQNQAYGFNFFKSGEWYESFPSGHSIFMTSLMVSLCFVFPNKLIVKILAVILIGLMMFSLIALNYHFLSDCMAGLFLGMLVTAMVHKLSRAK